MDCTQIIVPQIDSEWRASSRCFDREAGKMRAERAARGRQNGTRAGTKDQAAGVVGRSGVCGVCTPKQPR
ncbi:hypothetical protein QFZ91_007544 [Paraburkholderia sp. JPY419]